tara:strand:+ start:7 stop:1194 length:1188 start_codon:yes stop_codon:yes gene_type:complete
MKKIKIIIFFIALSSCNQYLGKTDPDYTPTNEVNEIFSNAQDDTYISEVEFGNIIFPKISNLSLTTDNLKLDKIINTDTNSVVSFPQGKIILSKDKNIHVIDKNSEKNNYDYKLNLNKEEKVLHIYKHRGEVYILTNRSRLFVIDGQNVINVADYEFFTNIIPIVLDKSLILFSVYGDIYEMMLDDFSITKKDNFSFVPGISIKSNIFEDQKNLYYLFNTSTLITLSKNNYEYYNNYILEDLNILSSLGVFNVLVDSPFIHNEYLYILDRSGKIAVFNPVTSDILWELDINKTILSYLFSNDGYLILLTPNNIIILSNKGNMINSYIHNKKTPISIFSIQGNIHLISEEGISKLNLNEKKEDSFYKNKFKGNVEVYFEDQIIYLKDNKSLFKLSE